MRLQKGMALIELLLGLMVILLALFIVAVATRQVSDDSNGKRMTMSVVQLDEALRTAYQNRLDYTGLTNTSAIQEGIIPPEWMTSPGNVASPVVPYPGILLTLATAGTNNVRYRATFDGDIRPNVCTQLLRSVTPAMIRVSVTTADGATSDLATSRGTIVTPANVGAVCAGRGLSQLVLENS